MNPKVKKWFFLALLVAFYWWSIRYAQLLARDELAAIAGYCQETGTIMTDGERIRKSVEYANKQPVRLVSEGGVWQHKNLEAVRYKSVEELLEKNPGCCMVVPGPDDIIGDRRKGETAYTRVDVRFNVRYKHPSGEIRVLERLGKSRAAEELLAVHKVYINNCGDVRTGFR